MTTAWNAFESGNYEKAREILTQASEDRPLDAEIQSALGWVLLRMDSLDQASTLFQNASLLSNPTAELYAGLAFTLNALKQYDASNSSGSQALLLDDQWVFAYDANLDWQDLTLVMAENHFLLGEFSEALDAVLVLNPQFTADPQTVLGRGQLASEIERLKDLL
ncbi:MAG: tetratricopeptide repeat protein [Bacteroidetes bacterium]|nr:tetratricopeptide repeat protein [Bacteroidota bacterium]